MATISHLSGLISTHRVCFVALLEPMLDMTKVESVRMQLQMDHLWVNPLAPGKIWAFWNSSTTITPWHDTPQCSSFEISGIGGSTSYISVVYASCDEIVRRDLWQDVVDLSSRISQPWLIGGTSMRFCIPRRRLGEVPWMLLLLYSFRTLSTQPVCLK